MTSPEDESKRPRLSPGPQELDGAVQILADGCTGLKQARENGQIGRWYMKHKHFTFGRLSRWRVIVAFGAVLLAHASGFPPELQGSDPPTVHPFSRYNGVCLGQRFLLASMKVIPLASP